MRATAGAGSPGRHSDTLTGYSWREARRYVLGPLVVGLVLLLTGRRTGWVVVGAAGATALFFRDPERPLVAEPGVVYSAADGIVTAVEPAIQDPWMPDGRASRVSVFLSLHNVHVNRSPVAGRVDRMQALGSGFAPALFRAAADNRRNRVALDAEVGRVVVVQVAGALARRISSWVRVGDQVEAGQRLGMIHFGSRTDVLLPVGAAEFLVSPGNRVRAGVTPIARLRVRGHRCAGT